MKPSFIPKDRASSAQPWQLNRFDTPRKSPEEVPAEVKARAAEAQLLRQRAYQAGFDQGYEQGRARVELEARRFAQLLQSASADIAAADQAVRADLVDLALTIARAVIRVAYEVQPELICAVIDDALHRQPSARPARLHLHPADAVLVAARRNELWNATGVDLVEDPTIEQGGCRLETSSGEVDATIESRWHNVVAALSRDHSWIRRADVTQQG